MKNIIKDFWGYVAKQDEINLKNFFNSSAQIYWYDSNELFDVNDYIIANCKYPGKWSGKVIRIEQISKKKFVSVTLITELTENFSFHVTSFFEFNQNKKIIKLEEYWSEISQPPEWRLSLNIGTKIQ